MVSTRPWAEYDIYDYFVSRDIRPVLAHFPEVVWSLYSYFCLSEVDLAFHLEPKVATEHTLIGNQTLRIKHNHQRSAPTTRNARNRFWYLLSTGSKALARFELHGEYEARAYNEGQGAAVEVKGQSSRWGVRGAKPPEAECLLYLACLKEAANLPHYF